jgi:glycosyltransferase involved in cell wall biosynthesis
MINSSRLFYIGMINSQAYANTIGYDLFMGAANRKMLSVLQAARLAGASAWLVSIPVLGQKVPGLQFPCKVLREQTVPALFLPSFSNRYLRKLLGTLYLAIFCLFRVRTNDRVIFYNHAFEYTVAVTLLWMRGQPAYLDIEDAPRADVRGIAALFGRLLFKYTLRLTHPRKIVVSRQIADELSIEDALVIHGVADIHGVSQRNRFAETGPLRILYGGTLIDDTGLSLFRQGVKLLTEMQPPAPASITFVITGVGGDADLERLITDCSSGTVQIEDRRNVSQPVYLELLSGCDAALSLKLPASSISSTTFPSKVVEITSSGLLLIATSVSDIPKLFGPDEIALLENATPVAFANRIMDVSSNRVAMAKIARQGQMRAHSLFSAASVGARLLCHLGMSPVQVNLK